MENVNNSIRVERDARIDIIKGIAILLVLWGHAIQNLAQGDIYYSDPIFKLIYSFHMPLFALVNGYLFYSSQSKRNFKEALISRVSALLIPIITWTSLDWVLGILLHKSISITEWVTIFTGNMLWFLWSILAANLVLVVAEKKIKPRCTKIIWLFIGFFLMYVFPNAELNLYLYPYVVFGFYYKKYEKCFVGKIKLFAWICIALFILLLPFYNENTFIYTSGISLWKSEMTVPEHILIDIYRYIIGIAGSVTVVFGVCKSIGKFKKIDKILSKTGCYTMQIYIIQCFFFKVFGIVFRKTTDKFSYGILLDNVMCRDIVLSLALCMVVLALSLSIGELVRKNESINKVLFGR